MVLGEMRLGRGTAFVFTPFLSDTANPQIQQWAYFNYLIYHLVNRGAGLTPLTFADYPGSPVPHAAERNALLVLLGILLAGSFLLPWVRRYSLRHPERLDELVIDRREYAEREASTDWEEIGFHRPMGGFLLALGLGLILFIPLIIYQNLILPVYILPSAQALGHLGAGHPVFQRRLAILRYGHQRGLRQISGRIPGPRPAPRHPVRADVYLVAGAFRRDTGRPDGGAVKHRLPRSAYALYSWSIIIHTFIQIPGFLR